MAMRFKLHRLLIFVGAIMRHGWALLLALVGSAALAIPGWVEPLLSGPHAKELTATLTVSTEAYRYLAVGALALGFLYSSFLAWDEERSKLEKANLTIEQLTHAPEVLLETDIAGVSIGYWPDRQNPTGSCVAFKVSIRNTGTMPSTVRHFQLRIPMRDKNYISLAEDMALAEAIRRQNDLLLSHHIAPISPGAAWDGFISFVIAGILPEKLLDAPMEFSFKDIRDISHSKSWKMPSKTSSGQT
jgi:hypothetical protein